MSLDIDNWLNQIGLGQYGELFRANDIDGALLRTMNGDELKELGVASLGHRKRLLDAISALSYRPEDSPVAAPRTGAGAERRQLTVMFCDLVGSTGLSSRLDPEDLQQLIRSYHEAVAAAVAPYAGHIAQLLGDGVLVYFGYPQAHEDDAARAVRAALNIVKVLATQRFHGDAVLQSRIGIATGRVVVGEIGNGTPAAERSASGETPNLAARLQGQAKPGEIVLADETRKLLGDSFALETLAGLELKGFAAPLRAWRVLGERSVNSRFEAQQAQGLVEFVGRDIEVALLLERWALARDGEGQAVLLSGEAGIGKSRICQTLRDRLAGDAVATVLLQCSPYFNNSALYPIVQHLERRAGMAPDDTPAVRAAKLEQLTGTLPPASVGCLLRLMGLPDGGRPRPGGNWPQQEKVHTVEALIELLQRVGELQPVLFLVEDAQWIDPSTEEFIAQVAQRLSNSRMLLLVTCRPQYAPTWSNASQLTRHSLSRLSQTQCTALANALTQGKALPAELLAEIIRKTDGIPLFVEELTKTVLQSGLLEDTPSGYRLRGPLSTLAIPSTLQDSLMARLDQLAPAKEVAQIGAVIGREFGHRLIAEVLSDMPAPKLEAALAALVRAELVFRRGAPPDASYSFKHALVRDTAYNSMLKSQRVLRHAQIAAALEKAERDGVVSRPELLAVHHQEGGNSQAALRYWQSAGDAAMARSAVREALSHYQAALALIEALRSKQPFAETELLLQLRLLHAAFQVEGVASARVKVCAARARELAVELDRPDEHAQACGQLAGTLTSVGRYSEAIAMLGRFSTSELARMSAMNRAGRLIRIGTFHMWRGELAETGIHFAQARGELENVRPQDRQLVNGCDPSVALLGFLGTSLHVRGLVDSSEACRREALAIAEQRNHLSSRVWAMCASGTSAVAEYAQALELAERYGFKAWAALAKFFLGCRLTETRQQGDGTSLMRKGYSEWAVFAGVVHSTGLAVYAASALLDAGDRAQATEFLQAGEKTLKETEEKVQAARLLVLRGRLGELDGEITAAEALYRQAITIAEQQGALLYGLQAATACAQLFQKTGRAHDAGALLRPIYERFTEGFNYPDLVHARATLECCA